MLEKSNAKKVELQTKNSMSISLYASDILFLNAYNVQVVEKWLSKLIRLIIQLGLSKSNILKVPARSTLSHQLFDCCASDLRWWLTPPCVRTPQYNDSATSWVPTSLPPVIRPNRPPTGGGNERWIFEAAWSSHHYGALILFDNWHLYSKILEIRSLQRSIDFRPPTSKSNNSPENSDLRCSQCMCCVSPFSLLGYVDVESAKL